MPRQAAPRAGQPQPRGSQTCLALLTSCLCLSACFRHRHSHTGRLYTQVRISGFFKKDLASLGPIRVWQHLEGGGEPVPSPPQLDAPGGRRRFSYSSLALYPWILGQIHRTQGRSNPQQRFVSSLLKPCPHPAPISGGEGRAGGDGAACL